MPGLNKWRKKPDEDPEFNPEFDWASRDYERDEPESSDFSTEFPSVERNSSEESLAGEGEAKPSKRFGFKWGRHRDGEEAEPSDTELVETESEDTGSDETGTWADEPVASPAETLASSFSSPSFEEPVLEQI